ncbi:hypothetical protein HMPREF0091_10530 [Fannyhessea vaginae DSM 15829]|uniref:Uncharacterized protein n=1 Tax=Fannyhessea vaginae DSM 15829 TaxID=525256 RepID=F1T4D7_9ACTN|nr:hypothetical protein HMPREF0091_10528 [Fannyhessea vaginae DSM 15829]EGF23583.1 hypothetical protein HMPREF0091_10530 [Fannyhessea vaginae DSM 15829]
MHYLGITPAYAGKTHHYHLLLTVFQGSPPRMREKLSSASS